jgi:hypothetical protein
MRFPIIGRRSNPTIMTIRIPIQRTLDLVIIVDMGSSSLVEGAKAYRDNVRKSGAYLQDAIFSKI